MLDVAGVLAFAPRWVEQLAARYNAHGPAVLGDQRRRNGRAASVLTPALLTALSERLKTLPDERQQRKDDGILVRVAQFAEVDLARHSESESSRP